MKGPGANIYLPKTDFLKLLDEFRFATMIDFKLSKGKFSILTDVIYLDLKNVTLGDINIRRPRSGLDIDLNWRQWVIQFGTGYTVLEFETFCDRKANFDLRAGARYVYFRGTNTLFLPRLNIEVGMEGSEDFTIPWVGGLLDLELRDRLDLSLSGDVGGFGMWDSHGENWQAAIYLKYEINPCVSLNIGWRHLLINVADGMVSGYRARLDGPIAGVTFTF